MAHRKTERRIARISQAAYDVISTLQRPSEAFGDALDRLLAEPAVQEAISAAVAGEIDLRRATHDAWGRMRENG